MQPEDLKLWAQKWRWYERASLPWNRARIHFEFARRRSFCRWPVHGNVLEMLQEGRLELGEHVLLEPRGMLRWTLAAAIGFAIALAAACWASQVARCASPRCCTCSGCRFVDARTLSLAVSIPTVAAGAFIDHGLGGIPVRRYESRWSWALHRPSAGLRARRSCRMRAVK